MDKHTIRQLIEAGLPGATVNVDGDDGQHFEADVVWSGFAGKSPVAQHQAVYATLGERMGREIHALKLKTRAG
jgi:acid stress-induced BolA-like protein IbaG/YrbA